MQWVWSSPCSWWWWWWWWRWRCKARTHELHALQSEEGRGKVF
jgi:hypothetical protein